MVEKKRLQCHVGHTKRSYVRRCVGTVFLTCRQRHFSSWTDLMMAYLAHALSHHPSGINAIRMLRFRWSLCLCCIVAVRFHVRQTSKSMMQPRCFMPWVLTKTAFVSPAHETLHMDYPAPESRKCLVGSDKEDLEHKLALIFAALLLLPLASPAPFRYLSGKEPTPKTRIPSNVCSILPELDQHTILQSTSCSHIRLDDLQSDTNYQQ